MISGTAFFFEYLLAKFWILSSDLNNNGLICQYANVPIGCAVYRMALAYWQIIHIRSVDYRVYFFDVGSFLKHYHYCCPVFYFVFLSKECYFSRCTVLFYMYMSYCSTCTCRTAPHVHVVLLYMYI